ncbi:MAG: phosphohydrolase [Dehalococcoidia bacterium]|nr:MAG: phosphohydrolase [Dehalococcoidia bacterium]
MNLGRVLYRTRQFAQYTLAARPDTPPVVEALLSPSLAALFRAMDPASQRHHLRVLARLQGAGVTEPDALAAALLHDVGKGRISPLVRAVYVLARWLAPGLPAWLGGNGRRGWPAMYRLVHHATLGAALVAAAGGSPRVVWLIAHHQRHDLDDPVLQALAAADDAS